MPRYKITQSLISAWNYVHNCWEGQEDAAMESFLTALRGEKEELTPEQMQNIQNGFDFEKLVTDIATGAFHPQWEWATDKDGNLSVEPNTGEPMGANVYPKWYRPAAVPGQNPQVHYRPGHGIRDSRRAGCPEGRRDLRYQVQE